ncbi:MAG: Nif3-like dinuclear metal center hexameric protein [Saprospiraceae bacterium]
MKIKEITDYLEQLAPLGLQESYDNSGLLIGDKYAECSGALISLDVTEDVVDECIEQKCNLIIAHHPLIFKGLKRIVIDNYVGRTVAKAIKNDIAVYAIHTNLDNVFLEGVSAQLARRLNLELVEVLKPMGIDKKEFGAGVIANTIKPYSEMDFLIYMKEILGLKSIKYTSLLDKEINRVAICGGSGSFLINEAIQSESDIFISADFKYHDFFDANGKIILADIGHYESEIYTINLIFDKLKNNFTNFALHLTSIITNPINYL